MKTQKQRLAAFMFAAIAFTVSIAPLAKMPQAHMMALLADVAPGSDAFWAIVGGSAAWGGLVLSPGGPLTALGGAVVGGIWGL